MKLTKREYFTAKAMQGLLSNPEWMRDYKGEKYLMQGDVIADVAIKTSDTILAKLAVSTKGVKTEEELNDKLQELTAELERLELKLCRPQQFGGFASDKDRINLEFLKNNIAFVNWALGKPFEEKKDK